MDFAQDGDLSEYEAEDIADACEWPGDPEELLAALIKAGFIDEDYQIHDWFDYAGRLIEKREKNKERKQKSREGKKMGEKPAVPELNQPEVSHEEEEDVPQPSQSPSMPVTNPSCDEVEDVTPVSHVGHAHVTRPSRGQACDEHMSHAAVTGLPYLNLTVPKDKEEEEDTDARVRVTDFYQNNIGQLAPIHYEYLDDWLKTFDADVLILAMRMSVDRGAPKWSYINATLKAWQKAGAKTLSDCQAQIVEFERRKNSSTGKSRLKNKDGDTYATSRSSPEDHYADVDFGF